MDQLIAELDQKPEISSSERLNPISYNIGDYSQLKGKSGIFFLNYNSRIVYIGCSIDLYQAIHTRVLFGAHNNNHFLFERITSYSFLLISEYDKGAARIFRDALIKKYRPFINAMLSEYLWASKIINQDVYSIKDGFRKEKKELEKLRVENEELKTALDNLINTAMKIRKEK